MDGGGAADGGPDASAARLTALESTVAEIWQAVRERQAPAAREADGGEQGAGGGELREQLQRLEDRLARRALRASPRSRAPAPRRSSPTCSHPANPQFISHACSSVLRRAVEERLPASSPPPPAAGSPPARHTRARSEARRSTWRNESPDAEISALMRPDPRRAKSAPRARAPAAQHRSQISALKDEFASFSMEIDRKATGGGAGAPRGGGRSGRARSRTPHTPRTPRSQRGFGDDRMDSSGTPRSRSRSRQRGGSQAGSRPAWSNASTKSPVGLGPAPRGQGPRRSGQQAGGYGRSKSTPRQQRLGTGLGPSAAVEEVPSVYSRRLARRHAALQREVEVASVVENAAHHGVLADDLAAKLGQRKLRQRELQLQQQQQEERNEQGPVSPLSLELESGSGSRRGASPRRAPGSGTKRGERGSGTSADGSSVGSYEVWQGRPVVRLEDELRGGGASKGDGGRGGRKSQKGFEVRPWSPSRDGVAWQTLDSTAERGSAHSAGNDLHARAEYARREAMLAHSKAEIHRMRSMGAPCPLLSSPVLSCPVLSCPVPSRPVLSCPVLSCPVLFCSVLSLTDLLPPHPVWVLPV